MKSKKRYLIIALRFIPLIAMMVVAFVFSDMPSEESNETSEGLLSALLNIFGEGEGSISENVIGILHIILRKMAHFTEYAIMALTAVFGLKGVFGKESEDRRVYGMWPFLIAFIYSITDEIHQYFVPGRYGRWYDVCIDSAGAAVGLVVLHLIRKK